MCNCNGNKKPVRKGASKVIIKSKPKPKPEQEKPKGE